MLLLLIFNLRTFPRLQTAVSSTGTIDDELPLLSILVPARNEEKNIEACVRSLVMQRYERLEVLVLDDQSSDATARIVQQIVDELPAALHGRLRLLQGQPLPSGWIGKNFACYQLTQQARGDYLLFTDADTVHAPMTAEAVLRCMKTYHVQLLSAQPEHILGSLGERLVIPLFNFKVLTLLPIVLIYQRPEPSLSLGNGQLLCFRRSAYESIGGHARVKGNILEDVLLARAMKNAGYRTIFVDAQDLILCRMYHSWPEVWAGFSKNLFALYNYSLLFALCSLCLNIFLFILPPLIAFSAFFITLPLTVIACSFGSYLLVILMHMLLTMHFVHHKRAIMLLFSLLHPVSIVLECLILLNAIRWHYRREGTVWKGRSYSM